jgi:hypothetical protein
MDIEKVQGLLRKAIAKTLQIQDDEQATEQIDMLAHDAFEAARDVSYLIADWESKVTADGVTHPLERENKELKKRLDELSAVVNVWLKDDIAEQTLPKAEDPEYISNMPLAVSNGPMVPSSDLIPVVLVGGALDCKTYFAPKDAQAIKVAAHAGQAGLKKYVLARDAYGNPAKNFIGQALFVSPDEPALMRFVNDVFHLRREIQAIEERQTRPLVEDQRGEVELFGGPAHLKGGAMSSIKSTYKIPFRINSDSGLACYELAYDEHGQPRKVDGRFIFVWIKNQHTIIKPLISDDNWPF